MYLQVVAICSLMCLSFVAQGEGEHITRFATKTAYRNRKQPIDEWTTDVQFLRENCKLLHVTQVTRHGTRSPSKKQVRKLERLHARLMSSFHGKDYLPSLMNNWKSKFRAEFDKLLSPVGKEELFSMGQRFHKRYSPLMKLSEDTFRFISSSLSRAKESAFAFMKGLALNFPSSILEEKEKLVRYFAYCQRYQTAIKKNKTALSEYYNFKNGPEMDMVVNEVRARFQLNDIDLSSDDLELIFVNCGFEIANNVSTLDDSPWCQLLFTKEASVIEYLQDIKQYWRKSYPYKLNYLQSCPLVSDILVNLRNASEKDHSGSAVLYFGHAETLIPVVTALGLFHDAVPLRASNMAIMDKRLFRTSAIAPFAGNMALELYRCSASGQPELVLRPLVNERPVRWELCGTSFCPYEQVMGHLSMCTPARHDQADLCAKSGHGHDEL